MKVIPGTRRSFTVKITNFGNIGTTVKYGNIYIQFTTITKDYMILGKQQ
jgi:hypothetical protein